MNFNSIHILFLIIFLYNASITCATIQTLPPEIVKKILMFNNFDLDDYHSNISIANSLNENSFFQDSPCQIVAHLFQKPKPNLMLTCKQFDNYIKRNIKNEIPSQHQLYINFLIENQSLFNFKKKKVLKNLALLLFNVYGEKINGSYNNNLQFYEPLAFSLTFKKCHPDNFLPNPYKIWKYKKFFENVSWFNNNLTLYISEPEKLFLIGYLSITLNIEFLKDHKPIFEKILKTKKRTKYFLKIIKDSIKQQYDNQLIKTVFYSKGGSIEANKNTIKIMEFFVSNNINLMSHYEYGQHIDSQEKRYKNTLMIIEPFSYYKSDCNNCLENKKSLIAVFLKNNFYSKEYFLDYIIEFLIKQENNCNHTTFENQNIKNWIQKTFPRADYEKIINIVSLLKNISFIDVLNIWNYTRLLDKNSTVFKNMVKLSNFCQKCNNYALKAAAHLKQNPEIWRNNYYLTYGFADNVLFQVKCYCYNCNKNRLYYTDPVSLLLKTVLLAVVIMLIMDMKRILTNTQLSQKLLSCL